MGQFGEREWNYYSDLGDTLYILPMLSIQTFVLQQIIMASGAPSPAGNILVILNLFARRRRIFFTIVDIKCTRN